ncbi:MAG: tRNA uracil 4-sulfurtransferase ThiI [Oscillospiraceae bacterium]|nr:tRNA uracil 4-sulfurtransferase ThiI [Oscillospiraceae bacterium]
MNFKRCILLKYGEIVLKGQNKGYFEDRLRASVSSRLRRALGPDGYELYSMQSTVYIMPRDDTMTDAAMEEMRTVFGLGGLCVAWRCEKDIEEIKTVLHEKIAPEISGYRTFKCDAKRSDKKFPLTSPEIMRISGDALLETPGFRPAVDVIDPEITVMIEIRDKHAFVHAGREKGAGGMPRGSSGKAILLLSGGIDSPVAGYMAARRGAEIEALHFESYPYTSERAKEKVFELSKLLCRYTDRMRVFTINLTPIQLAIKEHCDEEYFTLILRRFMMRLASRLSKERECGALITGESLGQVASQTMKALAVTDAIPASEGIPVLRPCIGMDKDDIITIARHIGTFDTSILPYEDCCTVFTPRHPKTNPSLECLIAQEEKLDISALCEEAYKGIETRLITY